MENNDYPGYRGNGRMGPTQAQPPENVAAIVLGVFFAVAVIALIVVAVLYGTSGAAGTPNNFVKVKEDVVVFNNNEFPGGPNVARGPAAPNRYLGSKQPQTNSLANVGQNGGGVPSGQPSIPTGTNASMNAAYQSAVQTARKLEMDSLKDAQGLACGSKTSLAQMASGPNASLAALGAGATDVDRSIAMTQGLAGMYPDQTGKLPKVMLHHSGPSLLHALPTTMATATTPLATAFQQDNTLALVDPTSAAKVDRAMSVSAVPASWSMDDTSADQRRSAEIVRSMYLTGAVDPSINDVLAATSPFTYTQSMIRRSLAAKTDLENAMVLPPPMSQLYQSQLLGARPAVPVPTMSAVPSGTNITPGQQYFIQTTLCGVEGAPLRAEPF